MDDTTRAGLDLLLAEYRELKAEQRDRMGLRDGMTAGAIGVQAAAVAATASGKVGPLLLLALPPVAFALGWVRLSTAAKVAKIRRYVRGPLRHDATRLAGLEFTPFGWETYPSSRRTSRRAAQLVSDLVVFVAGPAAAVVTSLSLTSGGLAGLAVLDGALLTFLGVEIARRADLRATPR